MHIMLYAQIKLRQTNLCRKYRWVCITYWMTLVWEWAAFRFSARIFAASRTLITRPLVSCVYECLVFSRRCRQQVYERFSTTTFSGSTWTGLSFSTTPGVATLSLQNKNKNCEHLSFRNKNLKKKKKKKKTILLMNDFLMQGAPLRSSAKFQQSLDTARPWLNDMIPKSERQLFRVGINKLIILLVDLQSVSKTQA